MGSKELSNITKLGLEDAQDINILHRKKLVVLSQGKKLVSNT